MSTQLPNPIATFFEVSNGADSALLAQCFAPGATVHDEGRTHQGHAAIRAWLQEAQRLYEYSVEPLEASQQGTSIRVLARVVGNFPGSPVQLEHLFRLSGDRIASLEIG
ncbi:nuclear transport factor 2 family protein [Zestomonas carbonaria]|uniref:SnoaL-like domain-containing protein n=1 Tax=Zestomonas carbonaria TaxID=2762745 RepID=A0A7U7ESP2_9GAMM|nr:nuclear transport factor 2 family protein [Pseudomonas carbonaria]CAD5109972.1 hypothetical protein PSEWESI4_04288 [Pseudomonas carbonaria]